MLCPGEYILIRVTHPAYITLDHYVRLEIEPGASTRVDVQLRRAPELPFSGEVTLRYGASYNFLSGERDGFRGGELYAYPQEGIVKFWATHYPQRGVVDLGDIGDVDLATVPIVQEGYTRSGVDAVVGHTYIALAREGEQGHHIVFRLEAMTQDTVVLRFLYR
jgi:hypothetical protein